MEKNKTLISNLFEMLPNKAFVRIKNNLYTKKAMII